jgi:integrase
VILSTGVRVGECMGAAWASPALNTKALAATADEDGAKFGVIDLTARTWHLPNTKNEREHTIHLSDFALARLAELTGLRERDDEGRPVPWVFPATDRTRPVCIKSFGKQLADRQREPEARMSNRSKATTALMLPGGRWTAHDLRRTAATIMARLGFGSDTINECLNHMQADRMARVYIQDRREADQRRAFDALGRRLAELADGRAADAGNVVALPQRAA